MLELLSWTFAALSVVLGLTGMALIQSARRWEARVRTALGGPAEERAPDPDAALERAPRPWEGLVQPLLALVPEPVRRRWRQRIATAGLARALGEGEYLLLRGIAIGAGVAMGLALYPVVAARNPAMGWAAAGLMALICLLLPDYWLQSRAGQRQYRIRRTLPDGMDLLVVSVEAGVGFDGALQRVQEKFPGPIADEFGRALQEMQLGKPRATALRDMAARCGVPEFSAVVASICMADQLGVGMANVLRVQAPTLRQRRLYQIRELAQKLPVKMLFPLVFFFPAVFVVIMGAGMIRIYEALLR